MNTLFAMTENKCWMLVDDNTDILRMMSAALKKLTDAAIECHSSPLAALAAFATAPEKYELVVTDFEMPGVDGVELCRRMRALFPAQKIFLATGSGLFTAESARFAGFCGLLNKPFSPATLIAALRESGIAMEAACAA